VQTQWHWQHSLRWLRRRAEVQQREQELPRRHLGSASLFRQQQWLQRQTHNRDVSAAAQKQKQKQKQEQEQEQHRHRHRQKKTS
jgi:hypothetical protein